MVTKVALFDFDDTIIKGDSGGMLLKYYIKRHPLAFFRLFVIGFYLILYKLHVMPINKAKSGWLKALDTMSDQEVETFYRDVIEKKYYQNVVDRIHQLHNEGYTIYICSASVEAYLRFCRLPVDAIIGTRVEIINGKYTSKMIGKNCKDGEKVNRINEELKKHNLEIDYDNSYAYSDSYHDVPMLKMVKNRVRISTKDGSMSEFIID